MTVPLSVGDYRFRSSSRKASDTPATLLPCSTLVCLPASIRSYSSKKASTPLSIKPYTVSPTCCSFASTSILTVAVYMSRKAM